jgi:hypothetical protein
MKLALFHLFLWSIVAVFAF